jgi:ArsR family transcriptional regulator, cadmium/lead-responsive transcriptional repressor
MKELALFRCLADPTRLTVLQHLAAGGEHTVTELVDRAGQERTNVSHHLAQLRACGLVRTRNDGRNVLYALAHSAIAGLLATAAGLAAHMDVGDPKACLVEGCC